MGPTKTVDQQIDHLAQKAQQAAEEHLERLAYCLMLTDQAAEADDGGEDQEHVDWPDTAASYCGCTTCDVRESLWIAYPFLKQIALLEGA